MDAFDQDAFDVGRFGGAGGEYDGWGVAEALNGCGQGRYDILLGDHCDMDGPGGGGEGAYILDFAVFLTVRLSVFFASCGRKTLGSMPGSSINP